ncbi:MAG: 2-iminoacetate synthase ThiH [Verrucomicrobiota bacterium]|nr:2-iminoacetate synthase ThiH [Verrucomicrobiota bacterium]
MSFVNTFDNHTNCQIPVLEKFKRLLKPVNSGEFEKLAQLSAKITRQNFGYTMRLFAPLYLSNECINNCTYCGFSRSNAILRVTLTIDQVVAEAEHLHSLGFRSLLLVAGEHPKFVSEGYLEECIKAIRNLIPSIALEVGPMETSEYQKMVTSGCEALIVYQETYDRSTYKDLHTSGPKKDFNWRLECPERAYHGGFRRIGIGALFGLSEWRNEALALASHLAYLQLKCWKANYTVSFPRIRPAAGGFNPTHNLSDKDFLQLVFAFRISFPEVGIILSTRESESLRNNISKLGITSMSAGSHTEPGGYTGKGTDDLHYTVRGKRIELHSDDDSNSSCSTQSATEQFEINDDRSPKEICKILIEKGLDPVWKDWDQSILCSNHQNY